MTNRKLEELEKTYLSDSSVEEFDSIMGEEGTKALSRRAIPFAAAILLVAGIAGTARLLEKTGDVDKVTTVNILEAIETLTATDADNIRAITARPGKTGTIITAEYKDGKSVSYILKAGTNGSSIELTAKN